MDMNLSPKLPQNIFQGEGGSYYSWSNSEYPLLGEAKVGAGKLVLQPHGFALPHYSDCNKVGFVLEGNNGVAGMTLSNASQEMVLSLKKGDVIPVPLDATSWWYNSGESELTVVFLGETSKAWIPGEFTYFLLAGTQGILSGFSTEFIARAYDMTEQEAHKLANSQTGVLIIKLDQETAQHMPQPQEDNSDIVKNIVDVFPDIDIENGGLAKTFTGKSFPLLENVGLSTKHIKLHANAMLTPMYTSDAAVQMIYVGEGFGKVQIVGINGERVLDSKVEAGQLLVVPKFFAFAVIAGGESLDFYYVTTSSRPHVEELASKNSVLNVISPKVLQVSFKVASETIRALKSKIEKSQVIVPPTK